MTSLADTWPAWVLLGLILLMPWGVGWAKRRGWLALRHSDQALRVVSALAVGPQQKVVTVAVEVGTHTKWLVLGVTPQSVTKLESFDAPLPSPPARPHETPHP